MACHETVTCPRCKSAFECRVGTILRCQCQAVPLTAEERQYISEQYSGCLCADCLQAVKSSYKQEKFRQRLQQVFTLFGKR
ncbi:cysteine-rich CWC family protein [Chitinophaga japonensis]|uniref:Cysteine-rich CWC n=1 Tax=Chitinophaga japonensis TaxID=104662 RepID=A0A562SLK5_CHIJA|nr:cysteine-rich CWC family protein [Chitinophaga japonensis]TWI82023.1 Cysteine-rich CWC [Chitinophaga japonensis]